MNYRYSILLCAAILTTSPGCAAFKESTGEYITEAVRDKIKTDIDEVLEKRGLSLKEIEDITDQNGDGVQPAEIVSTVKDLAKDYLTLQGRQMLDTRLADIEKQRQDLVTHNELNGNLKTKAQEMWLWLLGSIGGLISTYLGKQIWSAKKDGKRDAKIAILEKILQKDLDQDGVIGNGNGNGTPVEA